MGEKDKEDDHVVIDEDGNPQTDAPEKPDMGQTTDEPTDDVAEAAVPKPVAATPGGNLFQRGWRWARHHKKLSVPLAVAVIIALLAAIPPTRFALAGTVISKQYEIHIIDQESGKPITAADVTLGGTHGTTDNHGVAKLKSKVGARTLSVAKKYYQSTNQTVTVPILKQKAVSIVKLKATGRQVPITVSNVITKQAAAHVKVTAAGSTAETDDQGKAVMVLPADQQQVAAKLSGDGFNGADTKVTVSAADLDANHFMITPAGKVFFLSNQSGKIDVVSANLDGSGRQTVVAGTGREDPINTSLLASRDWKYLALQSKRDGGDSAKLFLIDTATGKLSTIDEGDATFSQVGWSNHRFIYQVNRNNVAINGHRYAIKSYDADAGKLIQLTESAVDGYSPSASIYQIYNAVYQVGDQVFYAVTWRSNASNGTDGPFSQQKPGIYVVNADGTNNHAVKTYNIDSGQAPYAYIYAVPYEPGGIYLKYSWDPNTTEEYEDGQVKAVANVSDSALYGYYPTYLQSPSGDKVFWSEPRDGKYALFTGDNEANNKQQVANLSEYTVYGWYTDKYLLVSKNGSELYVMSMDGKNTTKVSDYFKPSQIFRGYGGGYGGL